MALDALCFAEAELGILDLLNAEDMDAALSKDPWIRNNATTVRKKAPHALYEDLDKVIHINYDLVDVNAYSMKEHSLRS